MPEGLKIRAAEPGDAAEMRALMGRAFQDDPVSVWLFADPDDRERLQPAFFGVFVDQSIECQRAVIAEGPSGLIGVTLWFDVDPAAPSDDDPAELQRVMTDVIGPYAPRFGTLDALMTQQHPHHRAHAYLAFAAVDPLRQSQGVASALIGAQLDELDAAGRPAYLEASCDRNAILYDRLGFVRAEKTLDLPSGPSLYPMWRDPAPATAAD
ncbi:MAG TPA: GNAT family N-acetyltransferase [Micromonosporaceae bacterium]|nr:GNAT family N-acetyltransferase [Micromonosporaceae bacterium]